MMIYIPGEPRGKGRPRFTRFGRPYTDAKTRAYEREIAAAYGANPMHDGPVCVYIVARHGVPKSWPKAKQADALTGRSYAVRKPDADNIAKIVLDALNGVAWRDDTQVIQLTVSKTYDAEPSLMVQIFCIDDDGRMTT